MQTQEPSEYRFNSKVAIIVVITLLALIIPVTGVVLAVKGLFLPKAQSEEATVSAAPLQMALEDIAAKNLKSPPPMAGGDHRVELKVADPLKESQRIEKLAKGYDGMALPAAPEGENLRMLIQIPADKAAAFIKACDQAELGSDSPLTTAPENDEARVLIEIVIIKSAS